MTGAKIHEAGTGDTGNQGVQTLYMFHCPGCERGHGFHVPHWGWNGSFDKPTFTPSLMCNRDTPTQCHCNVTDGRIIFHADSHHALAGQTVDMQDWDSE